MRGAFLSTCAVALAACGGAGTSSSADSADDGTIILAQATSTATPAAAAGGPDLAGLPEAYQGANLANGRTQWFLCAACHQINDGNSHSVGPDLHGVFGRTAGTVASFPLYSPALKESGIVWSPETLDAWLANPRDVLATTTMIFPGVRKPEDRRDLIAYLWTEAGSQ